jgi:hypothetical protein
MAKAMTGEGATCYVYHDLRYLYADEAEPKKRLGSTINGMTRVGGLPQIQAAEVLGIEPSLSKLLPVRFRSILSTSWPKCLTPSVEL